MQPLRVFNGIEGLSPREPVGAALTIGIKGPNNAPTNTDRFFFVAPIDEMDGKISRRPQLPAFAAFNTAAPEKRHTIAGNLVHASRAECFLHHLKAQVLPAPWPAHPNKRPACTGDGATAIRYHGLTKAGEDDFREIACPNELCEFRQGDTTKACKPFAQLLFRPRWKDGTTLPQPLTKLTTGSWNSVSALLGFFEYVEHQAAALGVESPSLYGLPFTLTLSRKTTPKRQRAFPVLSITPDVDLVSFFLAQRDNIERLSAGRRLQALPPAALTDPDMQTPEVLASDLGSITPSKPAAVVDVAPLEIDGEPVLLSTESVLSLSKLAADAGLDGDAISAEVCGSDLDHAPASFFGQIEREIGKRTARKGGAR